MNVSNTLHCQFSVVFADKKIIADEGLDIETDGRKAGCCETRGPGLWSGAHHKRRGGQHWHYTTGVLFKWIIAVFRWASCGGWHQKMLGIRSVQLSSGGLRQDVLIALFIFGSKTQITWGGGLSEAQMALGFYQNRIEWQNKVFFNLNNVWNASPAIEGLIRKFWLDAEIKIGKELNYLGSII